MNTSEFLSALSEGLLESFKNSGFDDLGDGVYASFRASHEINVISIQPHSAEDKVCLNFGVHYDFLPKLGSVDLPDSNQIDLADCEIKVRITPSQSQNDYWWPLNSGAIKEISLLIDERSAIFFERYKINGEISKVALEDIGSEMSEILSNVTKVRACLILAHLHEVNEDTKRAQSFAELGIKVAGMAVGPKKALRTILKRVQPA